MSERSFIPNVALVDALIITNIELIEALIASNSVVDKRFLADQARFLLGEIDNSDGTPRLLGNLNFAVDRRLREWLLQVLSEIGAGKEPNKAFGLVGGPGRKKIPVLELARERLLIDDLMNQGAGITQAIGIIASSDLKTGERITLPANATALQVDNQRAALDSRIKNLQARHLTHSSSKRDVPRLKLFGWILPKK